SSLFVLVFFILIRHPPSSSLFPYTTLFRSLLFFFKIIQEVFLKTCSSNFSSDFLSSLLSVGNVLLPYFSSNCFIVSLAFTFLISDRKSTRLNSSHVSISYAVFCLKKKKIKS